MQNENNNFNNYEPLSPLKNNSRGWFDRIWKETKNRLKSEFRIELLNSSNLEPLKWKATV